MKKLALLGLSIIALGIGGMSQLTNVSKKAEVRDAKIIVKMNGDVENVPYEKLIAKQNKLLNEIASVTPNYRVKNRYTNIFNGFVLEVPSAYVSSIRYLPGVNDVNYSNIIAEESSNNDGVRYEISLGSASTASAQTMSKPAGTNEGSGTFVAILDNGFYIQTAADGTQTYHNVFAPLENEHVFITQADLKAKIDAASGFHGKYDDTHSTYYNNKVPFYYDYGGDTQGIVSPDFDVYAEGQDHGTHVASIAGGNAGEEYEGIAPKAQMALMKVFTTYMSGQTYKSGAYNDAILTALEDCLVLGVDSINMSLGTNLNDFDGNSILEQTIQALNNKGTFVNVAAGNDGKGQYSGTVYRYWQKDMVESNILSSHANNLGAMTVASCQADSQFYGEAFTLDGKNIQYHDEVTNYNSTSGKVEYNPERYLMDLYVEGSENEIEFVYTGGIGREEEYEGKDVTGKIAVVNRGDTTFREKVDIAASKGAVACAIINNTNETEFSIRMSFSSDAPYTPAIPVIFILQKDKESFENAVSNKIKLLKNVDLQNPYARQISDYSSDGMRYDLAIKPEITTPGENIKGAVLGAVNKYESMSGTSMATPNYAGAVALMISNHLGDAAYRKTINSRLMSTAQPMKDNTPNKVFTSVRRQGAGLVNLDAAINSKIYLDGVDASGARLNKAKIELFNGDKIKDGKLNLSFKAINEGDAAVSYTAKTYVLAPALDEYSSEVYPEFAGQKFQTTNEQLVEVFTDTVNVPVGETLINLPEHSLSADKKAALDADFESGCILEGFVILEATSQATLSIPFLGYYGDLAKVSPVEPFDFERVNDNKIYNSDILNYLITQSIGNTDAGDFTKADYSSCIVAGYWSSTSKVSISNVARNTTSVKRLTDGNTNTVRSLGMNPYTGTFDPNALFVGNNGYANTMVIQQFVNRSVRTNTLTLKNKATNEVVLTDHMFDMLMGSETDDVTGERIYPLYKSHFDSSLYDAGYMAHRAYSVIPLYKTENNNQINFPDGEYEMKFSYELSAGTTYEVSYNLTIESNVPVLEDVKAVQVNGQDYYRFYYMDTNLAVVNVNEKAYAVTKDENGKVYADIPTSAFVDSNVALVNAMDSSFAQEKFMVHVNDENFIATYNKLFISGYDFAYTVEGAGTNDQKYTFNFLKNGKDVSLSGAVNYRMRIPTGLDINTIKVYTVNARGVEKEITVNKIGDLIEFSNTIKVFRLTSDPVLTGISVTGPSKAVYEVGDALDLAGLVVNANMSNGEAQAVAQADYTVSPVDMNNAGEKTVTVSYQGYTATFTITVNEKAAPQPSSNPTSEPTSTPASEPTSEPAPGSSNSGSSSSGCGGSIAAGSMMLAVAAIGMAIVSLKKKRI